MIYLIHFSKKLKHAQHYLGFCEGREHAARIARHKAGRGARILAVLNAKGIGWKVSRLWRGPLANRDNERRLKGTGKALICPICSGPRALDRGKLQRMGR